MRGHNNALSLRENALKVFFFTLSELEICNHGAMLLQKAHVKRIPRYRSQHFRTKQDLAQLKISSYKPCSRRRQKTKKFSH